jgi:nitrite reductase/ring-hydroxylating ferredoxin subunit
MTKPVIDAFRTIARSDAIPNDFVVPCYLAERKLRICVARVDGRLYAFDDLYTGARGVCPLSGGLLAGTTIMSQCDGSRFDITTGAVINGPATEPLNVHEVREVDGSIQVRQYAAMPARHRWPTRIGSHRRKEV